MGIKAGTSVALNIIQIIFTVRVDEEATSFHWKIGCYTILLDSQFNDFIVGKTSQIHFNIIRLYAAIHDPLTLSAIFTDTVFPGGAREYIYVVHVIISLR